MVDSDEGVDISDVTTADEDVSGPAVVPEPSKQKGKGEVVPAPQAKLPATEVRDEFFTEAGMSEDVAKLDSLDRDILLRRTKELSAEDLSKLYPQIPKEKFTRLLEVANGH